MELNPFRILRTPRCLDDNGPILGRSVLNAPRSARMGA